MAAGAKTGKGEKMKIEINTNSYNQRRYSRPWIATVKFDAAGKAEFSWGNWIGDHENGSAGLLTIDAEEGDIIARGQKDFRQPKNSTPKYGQIVDGKIIWLASKAEAYTAYKKQLDQ